MVKKVTMQDIADRLHISKNSVSQALTGKPGVSEETRRLVQEAAQEMGYQYRSEKKQQSSHMKHIGLIASEYTFSQKSFFGEIYLHIEKEAIKRNMGLLIQSIDDHAKENLILPHFIQNNMVDGVLVLSHISTDYINMIIDTGIPVVIVDHHHPLLHADSILTNNRFGAYVAVQHLIERKHRDIAFVGNIDFSPSYQERYEGYVMALKSHGIEPKEGFMFTDASQDEETIHHYIQQSNAQPTAWFCVNDGYGFLVTSCLQKHGIEVPSAASVCSFDNEELSRIATPKLTTMHVNRPLFGVKAVEQLCKRMENPNEPILEILLPTELIVRESTAWAPHITK